MLAGEPKLAVEVFKLNLLAYPESADANDNLADCIWQTDKKIWHGSMPKKHWSSSIHTSSQRLPGPIQSYRGEIRATSRKYPRSSMRRIDKVTASVSRALPSGRVAEP